MANNIDPIQIDLTAPVNVRLEGAPADVALLAAALAAVFTVTNETRDYPNTRRGNPANVRRYLTIGETDERTLEKRRSK